MVVLCSPSRAGPRYAPRTMRTTWRSDHVRKLLPWMLGIALVVPVALPAAPGVALAQGCPDASPTPAPSAEPLLMPEDNRLALFDGVWNSIDVGYLDPTFDGKDWDAIGDAYAPLFLQV